MTVCERINRKALAVLMSALLVASCGTDDDEDVDAREITHAQVQANVERSLELNFDRVEQATTFLEQPAVWQNLLTFFPGLLEQDSLQEDFSQEGRELADFVTNHVFVQDNLEREEDNRITYLLRGDVVCGGLDNGLPELLQINGPFGLLDGLLSDEDGTQDIQERCVADLDATEVRLEVTSQQEGDLDIDVLIGPERHNPFVLEMSERQLAMDLRLGELRESMLHLATISEDIDQEDIPEAMSGRVRLTLNTEEEQRAELIFRVEDRVELADSEGEIIIDDAEQAIRLFANNEDERLTVALDFSTIEWMFLEDSADPQDEDQVENRFHLPGVNLRVELEAQPEEAGSLRLENVGLGDDTTRWEINGDRVFELDLNRDEDRRMEMVLRSQNDQTEIEVTPLFDLRLRFNFEDVEEQLGDIEPWMRDDEITIMLHDADNPRVLLRDDDLIEVLEGRLLVRSTYAEIEHDVEQGMCLSGAEAFDPGDDNGIVLPIIGEPTNGQPTNGTGEPGEEQRHPLSEVEEVACP